jgi:hypothetical protein
VAVRKYFMNDILNKSVVLEAESEGLIADAGDGAGDRDSGQTGALAEGTVSDIRDAVRDCQRWPASRNVGTHGRRGW